MAGKPLQFVPFSSALEAGFWHQLAKNKLEVYALDESPKKIHGFYFNGDAAGLPSRVSVDYTAFDSEHRTPSHCFPCVGTLINLNTIDAFKTRDKQAVIDGVGQQIFEDIGSGKAVDNPDRLSQFVLLTFADLKKYHFYYWFAFPCLTFEQDVTLMADAVTVDKRFSQTQLNSLLKSYDEFQSGQKSGFFVILENGDSLSVQSLSAFETLKSQSKKVLVGFSDPCTLETYPGWPLRNLLWLLAHRWGDNLPEVEVVCFRDRSKDGVRTISHSLVISVKLTSQSKVTECPRVVGWEKNERGKLGPRMVNLSASMDPTRLAESAVDLNLRLMRWRLLPELDLDAVSGTRCLLLGSGTLGCNVARSLLGWGVRTITLVDNGKISYSNPVRQSLFVFEDCLQGGQPKAETAAKALRKIFPGVNSSGLTLSIPMPGHPVGEGALEQTKADVKTLEELIESHDAVFLLMDTRESRWLPSLLCAARKKIVINAALGFDTFLVLRHGVKSEREHMEEGGATSWTKPVKGDELGCYFCNDVVAPGNSTKDRTLDQQCTVSRPGMSMIAAALAVEILVSVLQHPDRGLAAADTSSKDDHLSQEFSSCLGLVPHQIRGFLSRFHQVMPASRCFDKCTACSKTVLAAYQQEGFEFLLRAFNQPTYLEDLTGLTQMYAETNDAEVWGLSDEETDTGSMDS